MRTKLSGKTFWLTCKWKWVILYDLTKFDFLIRYYQTTTARKMGAVIGKQVKATPTQATIKQVVPAIAGNPGNIDSKISR